MDDISRYHEPREGQEPGPCPQSLVLWIKKCAEAKERMLAVKALEEAKEQQKDDKRDVSNQTHPKPKPT